jgi:hypothetical protein
MQSTKDLNMETIWVKTNGDITSGVLTTNLALIPLDQRPTSSGPVKRGYKRAFCLSRNRWVAYYTRNILKV